MSSFDNHAWSCTESNEHAEGAWIWNVYRDDVRVGALHSLSSGCLASDNYFYVFDVDGRPILDADQVTGSQMNYTNALKAIAEHRG